MVRVLNSVSGRCQGKLGIGLGQPPRTQLDPSPEADCVSAQGVKWAEASFSEPVVMECASFIKRVCKGTNTASFTSSLHTGSVACILDYTGATRP